jgi:hypothetical protein
MPWNLFIRGCGEDTRFVVGEAESKRERENNGFNNAPIRCRKCTLESPAARSLVVLARVVGNIGSRRLFTAHDSLYKMNASIEPMQQPISEILETLLVCEVAACTSKRSIVVEVDWLTFCERIYDSDIAAVLQ